MAHILPADVDPDAAARPADEYYGWFVVCNERVVLAADKTERSVWGDEGFPRWHPQFNGFMGIVHFDAEDPRQLPWTTTKRGIDHTAPLYRHAIVEMKKATQEFISYTNSRRAHLEEAKNVEAQAKSVPVQELAKSERLITPVFQVVRELPRIRYTTISYEKPQVDVDKVKTALGRSSMSNREMGSQTFDYFVKQELAK